MSSISLPNGQTTQLIDLLTVAAAAPGTSDEDRYQLHYCRAQLSHPMAPIEVLVLAGVLREATDRPELSWALRAECDRWSAYLAHLLGVASATTAAAVSTQPSPSSSTNQRQQPLRLAC